MSLVLFSETPAGAGCLPRACSRSAFGRSMAAIGSKTVATASCLKERCAQPRSDRGRRNFLETAAKEDPVPAERFDFVNAQGQRLAALLDTPAGEPRAYALFAHCFTCGKDTHAAKRVAEGLTALGLAVLRFDFT